MSTEQRERVIVGRIAGVYGIRGWVKVFSETAPKENIFSYAPWQVNVAGEWRNVKVLEGRPQGKGLVAQLESYNDRDQVKELVGADIAIFKDQLPKPKKGEYYWADMVGLKVVTLDDQELGVVDHLFETGANDVLVVKGERERLIPFVQGQYVLAVILTRG